MKLKRAICFILSMGLVLFTLAACGSNNAAGDQTSEKAAVAKEKSSEPQSETKDEKPKENITITYTTWNGGEQQKLEEAWMKKYMENNPGIIIEPQFIKYEDYLSKINTMIAVNEAPDVFFITEALAPEWGAKGLGVDLKPLYAEAGIDLEEKYVEAALTKIGDKVFAFTPGMATIYLYYNKNLFTEAGLEFPSRDPLNPMTWSQFVDAARKITTDKNGKHPGENGFDDKSIKTYGCLAPTFFLWYMPLLYSNNASFVSEDGMSLAINKPEGVEVIKAISDLIHVYKVAPAIAIQSALPGQVQMFKDNQLGMNISGNWSYINFKKENYDIGVAALPMFKKPADIMWSSTFMLYSKSKHIPEAFKFFREFNDPKTNPDLLMYSPPSAKEYYIGEKLFEWASPENYNDDFRQVVPSVMLNVAKIGENVYLKNFHKIVGDIISAELERVWTNESSVEIVVESLVKKTEGMYQGVWK